MELKPLKRAYEVDEAINTTDSSRIVIVRFGRESTTDDTDKKKIAEVDGWLESLPQSVKSDDVNAEIKVYTVKIYTVKMRAVPELVARYKLADPVTVLFFRDNIQGGRLQGYNIKKEEIDTMVHGLANKQKKQKNPNPEKTDQSQRTSTSNATRTNANSNKKDAQFENFLAWFREFIIKNNK